MITHVVMWTFQPSAEGADKAANLRKAKALLEELPQHIPQIKELQLGINIIPSAQAYDLVLIGEFADQHDLQTYIDHPEHQRVVKFLRSVHAGRVVVDFERTP
jgi:hypothetical protein